MSERLAEIEARVEAAAERRIAGVDHAQAERTARVWCANVWLPPWPNAEQSVFRNIANAYLDLLEVAHARSDIPWLLEREKKLREALELIAVGPRPLAASAAQKIARQALADSGEASGEAAESTDDEPPREDGGYDPRPDPRTHPEFWTE